MKKILFLIPTLGGGGAEKVLVNLANNLDKNIFDITIISLFNVSTNAKFLHANIKYKYYFKKYIPGFNHFLKFFSPKFLYKMIIKEKYDCIISFLEGETTRILKGCNDNTKIIDWIHIESSKNITEAFRNKSEMIKAYNKATKIVCVSKDVENSFNKITDNLFKNKVMTIKNINDYNDIFIRAKEKYETKSKFTITGIGRLTKIKDFERLIPIMYKLNKEFSNLQLLILGTGVEKANIENKIKELGLNNVYLLGYQENPYKILAKSDLYICCSHFEGFSTTTTEALILNIPIVTTNCAGMKDLLDNGKCGIIVDDSDEDLLEGIKKVINDIELVKKIKQNQIIKKEKLILENIDNIKIIENLITS